MVDKINNRVEAREWNHFVVEQNGSFLQSYEWGEFQKAIGREVFYLPACHPGLDPGSRNWQALVIKYQMPLGRNYLFCPHGPILAQNIKTCGFLEALQELAKKEKSVFLRVEPCVNCTKDDLNELCFEKSKDIQPHKTLILDLNLSEEELLAQMGEKTRYNIRLSERKGITVRNFQFPISNFQFEEFWRLLSITAKRQGIRLHGKEYYQKELNPPHPSFKKEGELSSSLFKRRVGRSGSDEPSGSKRGIYWNLLFIAEFNGKPIAANMVNIFALPDEALAKAGGRATYLHGGSDNESRSLMAPHLLQWEQIKYAKQNGCKIYDFWGCDDEKWPGVSRFKKGFGGREIEWCGTHDYVFDKWWYKIYKAGRGILR